MIPKMTGVCAPVYSKSISRDEYRKKISKKFVDIIRSKKIGYVALSEATGLSYSTLISYARGSSIPTLYTLQLLAEALDCSIDEFGIWEGIPG